MCQDKGIDMFTKKEQKQFEDIFEAVLSEKSDVARLRSLGDVIFEMTGNVNLRMWLHHIKVCGCESI